jgi:putative PIN family toxin of toxin-antitoxin system
MRVFLDTNVLASGFATRGMCADVVREVISSHELLLSEDTLQELERALKVKFKVSTVVIDEILNMLREIAEMALPEPITEIAIRDSKDVPILSSAINGDANVFVTGDKEVLGLRKIGRLRILSPRDFWETIKSGQQ